MFVINYNKSFPFSDDTTIQKQTYQAPESKHNVVRWIVDSNFKKDQERLKIPTGILCFSLYFNLLKRTGYLMHQYVNIQNLYIVPTLFVCLLFIFKQTLAFILYDINWMFLITKMRSVYCMLQIGSDLEFLLHF
jgi:hypothetical protein